MVNIQQHPCIRRIDKLDLILVPEQQTPGATVSGHPDQLG